MAEITKFGRVTRELMAARGMDGIDVANAIDISPNALSAILNDKSVPRFRTFVNLRNLLAKTPEETAMITAAYEGKEYTAPEPGSLAVSESEPDIPTKIVERAETFLDAKAHSIEFRNDVERVLQEAKISYMRDFTFDRMGRKIACDFVTKSAKNRIVIECKFALNRDWDHVLGGVVVVVPYHNAISVDAKKEFAHDHIPVVTISELVQTLRELGA
jgi:transcriptional regulator with XRE-family HTH domain